MNSRSTRASIRKQGLDQKESSTASQSFSMSFASLVIILLSLFVLLNAISKPSKFKQAEIQTKVESEFATSIRSEEQNTSIKEILQVAKEEGFTVEVRNDRIRLRIPGARLFDSGEAVLLSGVTAMLARIAKVVQSLGLYVAIEGHTDNKPISTHLFPSNWHLSAARAISVLRLFLAQGVQVDHISAAGRGDFNPIADNDTEQGRAVNRRVDILLSFGE